jgi:hypothetical protein
MREKATRPGRTLTEAFADFQRFYADEGFPKEWMLHQGGMIGYASREIIAAPHRAANTGRPGLRLELLLTGAKAEETFVLIEDGPEVITLLEEGGP